MKLTKKISVLLLAMLLVIGPTALTNNITAEETQEVKVTVHWDDDENVKGYRPDEFTVTLYTEEPPYAKYSVSVYDIEHDIDINGNTMGLTFGPALYRFRYK